MYRIHFDPRTGRFVVQVMALGIFWQTVAIGEGEPLAFPTYQQAVTHVNAIGLDVLYVNRSADAFRKYQLAESA